MALVATAFLIACTTLLPGTVAEQSDQIPAWVDRMFELYLDGQISDADLLWILAFLIDGDIIQVATQDGSSDRGIGDEGDFYVTYYSNPNSEYTYSALEYLQDTRLLEDNVEWLNDNYRLPYDVEIRGAECGVVNAFYNRAEKLITMCYEMVDDAIDIGYELYDEPLWADDAAYNWLDFVLLHEVGHALVDIYDLPVTGLEEDAVDQFSALIQSRTYDDYDPSHEIGQNMMFDVAHYWLYKSIQIEQDYYSAVHSLDIQRFYNIACYAYGADPEYNSDLVGDDFLPVDRANTCQYEYEQVQSSWDRLLEGYVIE